MIGDCEDGGFMHYVEEAEVTLSHRWLDYILNLLPSSNAFSTVLHNITAVPCMTWVHMICSAISTFNENSEEEAVCVYVD